MTAAQDRSVQDRRGSPAAPLGHGAGADPAPAAEAPLRPRSGEDAPEGLDAPGAVALALTALWLLLVAAVLLFAPAGPSGLGGVRWLMALVAAVLPVAVIWVAAISARSVRLMRAERARLAGAIEALREMAAAAPPPHAAPPRADAGAASGDAARIEARLDEIARAQRQTEAAIARLSQQIPPAAPAAAPAARGAPAAAGSGSGSGRAATGAAGAGTSSARASGGPKSRITPVSPTAPAPEAAQPRLALGTPDDQDAQPISNADFIRALNFPEDEGDVDGFRALRAALKDPVASGLVRSAQDVLTLLAEDGIYMDDLAPDRARPEIWRRFAQGERGKGVAALGGVRDRSCLARTSGRMRQDPVFRDTAHHFLRKFDKTFAGAEPRLGDAEIVELAETRTARAFMLLGRVSGTFD